MPLSSLARTQLSLWISQLLLAVPIRSRGTFVELLCACLVSPEGWVTRAISSICRHKHWTTCYKLIERGSIRIVPLARATFSLMLAVLAPDAIILVIDDTLVPRGSLSAPGCAVRFDHARKINRPEYMRTQNWVTLGISIFTAEGRRWVLPVLSRLVPATGNRNKLTIALALIRALAPLADIPIRVSFDSWFMRARLVLPLLHRGFQVVLRPSVIEPAGAQTSQGSSGHRNERAKVPSGKKACSNGPRRDWAKTLPSRFRQCKPIGSARPKCSRAACS